MTRIISSTTLRNGYNAVSEECRSLDGPIFVTKNGAGDLAVMGIESYERMQSRLDLYEQLMRGHRDSAAGLVRPATETAAALRGKYGL